MLKSIVKKTIKCQKRFGKCNKMDPAAFFIILIQHKICASQLNNRRIQSQRNRGLFLFHLNLFEIFNL